MKYLPWHWPSPLYLLWPTLLSRFYRFSSFNIHTTTQWLMYKCAFNELNIWLSKRKQLNYIIKIYFFRSYMWRSYNNNQAFTFTSHVSSPKFDYLMSTIQFVLLSHILSYTHMDQNMWNFILYFLEGYTHNGPFHFLLKWNIFHAQVVLYHFSNNSQQINAI